MFISRPFLGQTVTTAYADEYVHWTRTFKALHPAMLATSGRSCQLTPDVHSFLRQVRDGALVPGRQRTAATVISNPLSPILCQTWPDRRPTSADCPGRPSGATMTTRCQMRTDPAGLDPGEHDRDVATVLLAEGWLAWMADSAAMTKKVRIANRRQGTPASKAVKTKRHAISPLLCCAGQFSHRQSYPRRSPFAYLACTPTHDGA